MRFVVPAGNRRAGLSILCGDTKSPGSLELHEAGELSIADAAKVKLLKTIIAKSLGL